MKSFWGDEYGATKTKKTSNPGGEKKGKREIEIGGRGVAEILFLLEGEGISSEKKAQKETV